jgi:hypothetical protein
MIYIQMLFTKFNGGHFCTPAIYKHIIKKTNDYFQTNYQYAYYTFMLKCLNVAFPKNFIFPDV